ncbi:MAG: excinuclease ABC subunit UvrC [Clostridia bacterium]|nr:excinuclease ABC subunit UvrC [Clostridia bacterium]
MDLQTKIKELPTNSGVYIMKDINGEVIYVGKAKNLKNRVSQYFQHSKNHTLKVTSMVKNIADFRYIITPNEAEALALENNLIKRYQPYYNILLKDGKSYPYIRIDLKQDYPRLEIVRKLKRDGAKYFGPYFAGVKPVELIKMLNNAYPLRMCKGGTLPKRTRPCLNYDMGLCSAPCVNKISKEEYAVLIKKAMDFLNGKYSDVQEILQHKMLKFAENEQFESALIVRDNLTMLDKIKHTLTFMPNLDNIDAFAWASNGAVASVAVLIVRGGRSIGVDCFHLLDPELDKEESLTQFITQYYSTSALPPEQVYLPFEPDNSLKVWLTEQRKNGAVGKTTNVEVVFPQKGEKRKLLQIAEQNAEMYLEKAVEKEKRLQDFTIGAVNKLGEILGLHKPPRRMECYDISNIGGLLSVASMVVFVDGEAKTKHYRKFRIKTVEGANDFASMQEVLMRRLNELKINADDPSFSAKPDLIVIDGGKGQLSNALEAIQKSGFDIPVISLAKKEEEVFVPNKSEPIIIPRTHNALKLLQRIRDESHRFAITFHRSLRNKVTSILEEVEGIGSVKRKNLIKHFKSLENMKNATIQELSSVQGITQKDALALYKFLQSL